MVKRKFSKTLMAATLVSAMVFASGFSASASTGGASVALGNLTSTGMYTNLSNAEDSSFTGAIYVAPNGTAGNSGTYNSPLDLATALQKVADGKASSILLEGGTYAFDKQITIASSGTEAAYNVLKACKGANVILDFSAEPYNSSDTSVNDRGIQLTGNYWYVGGVTIKGAADNGMLLAGSHNIIERCIFNGNRDSGLQVSRSSSSITDFNKWPSYNYIVNSTSKNNCDPASYENADGFAAKLTCGNGNVFDGCLSYNNSDDGWDLYAKTETGPTGVVTIRNSVAMRNGKTEDGKTMSSCDGNGFKLGGSGVPTAHVVQNCLAIQNLHHGFTDNNNPSALQLSNITAFDNNQGGGKNNFSLYRCKDASVSNAISYTTNGTSDKLVNLSADHTVFYNSSKWYEVINKQAMDSGSSTARGTAIANGTTAADFIDATVPTVGTDFDKLWRNSDGTINTNGVGIISASSQFGTLASDGVGLGARFSSANKIAKLAITAGTNTGTTDPGTNPGTDPGTNPGTDPGTDPGTNPGTDPTTPVASAVHNFTTSGLTDSFFTISGNLSTSKGTVSYNGLTLTQSLKVETATKISFTTSNTATLTLVFNSTFNKSIVIDGAEYDAKDGIVTVQLKAGSHTITKGDTSNLYYIALS